MARFEYPEARNRCQTVSMAQRHGD